MLTCCRYSDAAKSLVQESRLNTEQFSVCENVHLTGILHEYETTYVEKVCARVCVCVCLIYEYEYWQLLPLCNVCVCVCSSFITVNFVKTNKIFKLEKKERNVTLYYPLRCLATNAKA